MNKINDAEVELYSQARDVADEMHSVVERLNGLLQRGYRMDLRVDIELIQNGEMMAVDNRTIPIPGLHLTVHKPLRFRIMFEGTREGR